MTFSTVKSAARHCTIFFVTAVCIGILVVAWRKGDVIFVKSHEYHIPNQLSSETRELIEELFSQSAMILENHKNGLYKNAQEHFIGGQKVITYDLPVLLEVILEQGEFEVAGIWFIAIDVDRQSFSKRIDMDTFFGWVYIYKVDLSKDELYECPDWDI